jgi:hypothetical protein
MRSVLEWIGDDQQVVLGLLENHSVGLVVMGEMRIGLERVVEKVVEIIDSRSLCFLAPQPC